MEFKATHLYFTHTEPEFFTEDTLPSWLAHKAFKWWFDGHVKKLNVGEHIDSDFQRITRVK